MELTILPNSLIVVFPGFCLHQSKGKMAIPSAM
jgi:hypothetical protein